MTLLHHLDLGTPSAPPIVLVHPLGGDASFWLEFADRLSADFRMIAVDLRFAGQSPADGDPVDLRQHVADLETLRAALDISEFHLIGCALGGVVAAAYAAEHPGRVKALVLANPGQKLPETARLSLGDRARKIRESGMKDFLPQAIDKIFAGLDKGDRYRAYAERFAAMDPEAHAKLITGFLDSDVSGQLSHLACPVLLVPGQFDILEPRETVLQMASSIPDATIEELPGASHFGPYQAPEAFAGIARRFLSKAH